MKSKSIFEEPDLYAKRSASFTISSLAAIVLGTVGTGLAVAGFVAFAIATIPAVGVGGLAGGLIAAGWQAAAGVGMKCVLGGALAAFALRTTYETARGTKVKTGVDEKRKKKNMSEIVFENRYCDDAPLRNEEETRRNPRKSELSRGLNGEDSQRKEESKREEHAKSKERNDEIEDEYEIASVEAKAHFIKQKEMRSRELADIAEMNRKLNENSKEKRTQLTTEVTVVLEKNFKEKEIAEKCLTQEKLNKDRMGRAIGKDPEYLYPESKGEEKPRKDWKIELARKAASRNEQKLIMK